MVKNKTKVKVKSGKAAKGIKKSAGVEIIEELGTVTTSKHANAAKGFSASKDADKFAGEISSFLEKACGLDIQTLSERDDVPYWIHSGSFAVNWIIGNSFFEGVPGTKAILVAGECLGNDVPINVKVSKELADLLQAKA